MFIDASAIVAILGDEDGWEEIFTRLEESTTGLFISPLVRFEVVLALARKQTGPSSRPSAATFDGVRQILDAFVARMQIEEVPVSPQVGSLALDAQSIYGKLVGHSAALNFGDCFAYACARSLGVPLLYKGDDFSRTDMA